MFLRAFKRQDANSMTNYSLKIYGDILKNNLIYSKRLLNEEKKYNQKKSFKL